MRRNEAYMTNQELNTHQIKVIGHCNPDTDSICSAIAYSRLKNMIDPNHPCKPCRAGLLNRETEFVLNYFNVPAPQLYTDVRSRSGTWTSAAWQAWTAR